jgi:hypothetical protein
VQQTVDECGHIAEPRRDLVILAVIEFLAMKDAFHEAIQRFNQKALVPDAFLADFDSLAPMVYN